MTEEDSQIEELIIWINKLLKENESLKQQVADYVKTRRDDSSENI